ncbi:MAG: nicotinate phosphoribosyltransferase [Acidimicrobiales bacterium]
MASTLIFDEYELTMSQSFWREGRTGEVAFELVLRSLPRHYGYAVSAGLADALDFLAQFALSGPDLDALRAAGRFDPAFLDHCAGIGFTGDVDAIAEGTPVGAGTPLLRITAPRIEASLVEGALLAIVSHQTAVATRARRIVDAAAGRPVSDFSLRRLPGVGSARATARAAWIGGVDATATTSAGIDLGIATTGTMAHHYVLAHGPAGEQQAFIEFLREFPQRAVVLVDTYDPSTGVAHAIAASRATGIALQGVRLDSGDLGAESRRARALLDRAGLTQTQIVATNDLTEDRVAALVAAGAPIDAFGVGTALATSAAIPALSAVYKLVAQRSATGWEPVMKHAAGKTSDPGRHQVFRPDVGPDVLALEDEDLPGRALLEPVMRAGQVLAVQPSLDAARNRCAAAVAQLPNAMRQPRATSALRVRPSPRLTALARTLVRATRSAQKLTTV